jgi:hypothetical protein
MRLKRVGVKPNCFSILSNTSGFGNARAIAGGLKN